MEKQTFLDLALSDLESSKVLYESKKYPQSVFYMQQAVEKLGKFLALSYGIHNEKDLKDIGHDALKIYKDVLVHFTKLMNTLNEKYDFEMIDLDWLQEQFKNITDIDLMNLNSEILDSILESLLESENPELFFDPSQEKAELLDQFLEFSHELNEITEEEMNSFKNQYHSNHVLKQIINDRFEGFLQTFPGYISASESAFYLAVVFTRHAVATRYVINESNPLSTYSDHNPLISRLPLFQKYLEDSIIKCKNFEKYSH